MGRRYKEKINSKEYCVVIVNGSKCKTCNQLIKELYNSFTVLVDVIDLNVLNDHICDPYLHGNYKVIVEKIETLKKNNILYELLFSCIRDYKEYYENLGFEFIIEY